MTDPGMAVKMQRQGLADLDQWLDGSGGDHDAVRDLIAFVDARHDCADFRVVTLLKLLHAVPDDAAPAELWREIERSLLGFRYWMDEPGDDSMCFWSENHQILFFTCALLAGQRFPDATFTNSGWTGAQQVERALPRIRRWLAARFRFGFTEWCSTTYYEEDAAALALLVDFAEADDIRRDARTILDLLFLDMAVHSFRGRLQASAGRAYEEQTKFPERADVNTLLRWAFGDGDRGELHRMSGVVTTSSYQVPEAIRAITRDECPVTVRTSSGLMLAEVRDVVGPDHDVEGAGLQYWLMEAFTNVESIEPTMHVLDRTNMAHNSFLKPLQSFRRLAGKRVLPTLIRALNPATQGVAIERADVVTHRTPHVQLSSAQRHLPGSFGDQQLIWIAGLPGDVTVYGTNPAAPMFDSIERGFSPSPWVGNGIKPDVAQADGVLLAVYDTTPRKGYLERARQHRSHLWWPFDRFDEVVRDERVIVGRSQGGFIAALALAPIVDEEPYAIAQHGDVTAWAIITGDEDRCTFEQFTGDARASSLTRHGRTTTLVTPDHTHELTAKGLFTVNGRPHGQPHPRYDTPWVQAERFPDAIVVQAGGHRHVLAAPREAT